VKNDSSGLPDRQQTTGQCRSETDLWSLRIKWRHSSGRFSLAAFVSLRLGENRRLNKEVHFSRRREGAKTQRRRHLFLKDHQSARHWWPPDRL